MREKYVDLNIGVEGSVLFRKFELKSPSQT